jgi:hypothetical protein
VYIKKILAVQAELEVIIDAVLINPAAVVTYDCVNNTTNRVVVSYDASNDPADLDFGRIRKLPSE